MSAGVPRKPGMSRDDLFKVRKTEMFCAWADKTMYTSLLDSIRFELGSDNSFVKGQQQNKKKSREWVVYAVSPSCRVFVSTDKGVCVCIAHKSLIGKGRSVVLVSLGLGEALFGFSYRKAFVHSPLACGRRRRTCTRSITHTRGTRETMWKR